MMASTRLLSGFATVVVMAGLAHAGEPTFEGKPANWWARELRFKPEGLEFQGAVVRLARGGAEAVPVLVSILAEGESRNVSLQAAEILTGIAIHDLTAAPALTKHLLPLCLSEHDRSFKANLILKLLVVASPDARLALRDDLLRLVRRAKEPKRQRKALALFAEIANDTPEDLRALLQIVLSGTPDTSVISALQSKGKEVLPYLVELLPSAKEEALVGIQFVLSLLQVPAADLFASLLPATKGPELKSARVLGLFLIRKADATGVTFEHRRELFDNLDDDLRVILIPKMELDAKSTPSFAEFVDEVLADKSVKDSVRAMLIALVSDMKQDRAVILLPHLIAGLSHTNPLVRAASANAIGTIGPPAAEALPLLVSGLDDKAQWIPEEQWVSDACAAALAKIGSDGFRKLTKLLTSKSPRIRTLAAFGLGSSPDANKPKAISLLEKALEKETDPRVRWKIQRALDQLRKN